MIGKGRMEMQEIIFELITAKELRARLVGVPNSEELIVFITKSDRDIHVVGGNCKSAQIMAKK